MTADEVAFAGGGFKITGIPYYSKNANGDTLVSSTYWRTMTPAYIGSSPYMYTIRSGQLITNRNIGINVLRPVISLKYCTQYSSGDGSSSNPYTVSVSTSCSSALN